MASLLPAEILGTDKKPMPTSALEGKVLGLYFSASWCGPCRAFSPMLSAWYAKFKAESPNADKFELVFVSSDRTQEAFDEYFGHLNFCALPFAERDVKAKLSSQFKVQGIPTLVIVDADGSLITAEGRAIVQSDPEGLQFPWRPPPVSELVGDLVDHSGNKVALEPTPGRVLGLYFSASWCGPCRSFSPMLKATYSRLRAAGKPFEVAFVSADNSESAFTEYFATMPWLAIPFGDSRIAALNRRFGVRGIPSLILLDENFEVISASGRALIMSDPEGENFPWTPKPCAPLTEAVVDTINEKPAMLFFSDNEAQLAEVMEVMKPLAEARFEAAGRDLAKHPIFFFTGDDADELPAGIRRFAGLGTRSPMLAILDVPNGQKYVAAKATTDTIPTFLEMFEAGKLPGVSLR